VIAESLARAGVGRLRIIDRDLVELTNLQRQVLFDETDARDGTPKAVAAARRLRAINSEIEIEPIVADFNSTNAEELASPAVDGRVQDSLLLDGTDNVETRYLINDLSIKHGVPWIYGACVGVSGRVMPIRPGATACLRCLFPTPPSPGELPTCDTAGVLGPAATIVAGFQAAAAIRFLADPTAPDLAKLLAFDFWTWRITTLDTSRSPDCPTCARRDFDSLTRRAPTAATLCGRRTVQIPANVPSQKLDLPSLATRLAAVGDVRTTPYFVKCRLTDPPEIELTVFPDGRTLVSGTADPARAKSIHARFVGA
jgi:adenylyltransferase/sulfurtransferase